MPSRLRRPAAPGHTADTLARHDAALGLCRWPCSWRSSSPSFCFAPAPALPCASSGPTRTRRGWPGMDVDRTRLTAMLWSGALCGLAGAVELSGVVGTLYENYAPGYGFTAVAVALLGRLNPFGIIASALFFGALTAGSGSMERTAGVSANLSYVLQAVTLLVLLGFQWVRWERRGPAAEVKEEIRRLTSRPSFRYNCLFVSGTKLEPRRGGCFALLLLGTAFLALWSLAACR